MRDKAAVRVFTEYIQEKIDLEGVLKKVRDIGYNGVAIVAAKTVPEYLCPPDEWLAGFRALPEKYDLKPVCRSAYVDMGVPANRQEKEKKSNWMSRP